MDFPSNSHKQTPTETTEPAKKIEAVVKNEVTRRKTPLGKRLSQTFVGGDAKSVAGFVFLEVLVPAAKDMVADAFSQGIERMIYGEARSTSRRTGSRPGGGYVSYNRMANNNYPSRYGRRDEEKREPGRRARQNHDFDDIIIATRAEADEVIQNLYDIQEQYDQVTLSDLFELVGITPAYTDNKWGWGKGDLQGAGVTRVREGYLLDLPKPLAID